MTNAPSFPSVGPNTTEEAYSAWVRFEIVQPSAAAAKIQLAAFERPGQRFVGNEAAFDAELRMSRAKGGKPVVQQPLRAVNEAQMHGVLAFLERERFLLHLLKRFHSLTDLWQQPFSFPRERHAGGMARKKLCSQLGFQPGEGFAQRRAGKIELFGRGKNAAGVGHGNHLFELIDLHKTHSQNIE